MLTLNITSRGRVTLDKQVLSHLGLKPGDKAYVQLLPNGCVSIMAAPTGDIKNFIGFLSKPGRFSVSIEEMNHTTERGWSGNL